MIQPNPNFRVVGVEDDEPAPSQQDQAVAIKMLQVALSALWARFTTAVADCFMLLAAASVFVLYMQAPADPSPRQLVLFGMYSAFVLLACGLVHWGRK